ncbi:cytidylyltransferase family-domain-containing protein [Mycena amicta]|nr:cytidylyltransferase family-domain-containing protein [Mycena amicta]
MSTVSKTSFKFASLAVDSGEESEPEDEVEIARRVQPNPRLRAFLLIMPVDSAPEPAPKLTKTALKKAAKAARQAKSKPTPPDTPLVHDIPFDDPQPTTESHVEPEPTAELPATTTELPVTTTELPVAEPPEPAVAEPSVEPPSSKSDAAMAKPAPAPGEAAKRQNMVTRTLWTFIMIGAFIVLLLLGHTYMILLVMLCQTLVYREVTALFSLTTPEEESKKKGKDPWSTTLNWYFFVVTNYFLYGESIIYYFKHVVFADAQLLPFATNHRIISFTLYTIGFVGFVMSLQKGFLKQQFGLFCWVHMSLLIIVLSRQVFGHFIMNNILEGLIWFWVPASLVICNDVFAYVWGTTFGRTPLIQLSPKKTVEGFVGAFWSTMIFGVLWGTYFMQFDYMICPVQDLGVSAWSSVKCNPNPVFVWRDAQIWSPACPMPFSFAWTLHNDYPVRAISSTLALYVWLRIFGRSVCIPGHGGMTDRMDCQFLMGVFVYVYYGSLVREHHVTVGSVLQTIVSGLSLEEQLTLMADLQRYLAGQGVLSR